MKKFIILILFAAIVQTGYGQYGFDLGFKGGLNNSKITVNSENFTPSTINNFHFGAFARINLNAIYLQPEAYFISKGGDIKEIISYNPMEVVSTFNYDMIDVPVMLGVRVIDGKMFNLRILGGPVFSFVTNSAIEGNDELFTTNNFKNQFFGWQYGVGIDFLLFTFDARIENSISDVYSSNALNSKNNSFLLSLGIKIL